MPLDAFLGQVMPFAGNFAPKGWAFCQGQLLPIQTNQALFSLLGNQFGGDGNTTFGLPDLRGRCAVSYGQKPGLPSWDIGQKDGADRVALIASQIPSHNHQILAVPAEGASPNAQGMVLAKSFADRFRYAPRSSVAVMAPQAVQIVGANQSHPNMQPSLAINYIICTLGLYPSRP